MRPREANAGIWVTTTSAMTTATASAVSAERFSGTDQNS